MMQNVFGMSAEKKKKKETGAYVKTKPQTWSRSFLITEKLAGHSMRTLILANNFIF